MDIDKLKLQQDIQQAEDKLEKIMVGFFYNDPLMLQAFCLLKKQANPEQDTIGIDLTGKHPKLTYNPNFVNMTHPEVLETIVISEGFRILLRHISSRLKSPRDISHMSSSMAINCLMNDDLSRLIGGIDVNEFLMNPEDLGLVRGKAHEEYFKMLADNISKARDYIEENWEQEDEGEEQEDDGDGGGFTEFDSQKDALHEYKNPMGTSSQGWGDDEHFDVAVTTLINENKDSARNWGNYSGKLKEQIVAAFKPKANPRDVLKRFYKTVLSASTQSTRMKVNRRYDILQPGRRRTYKTKIVFGLDVSGSMSRDDIMEGLAMVNGCLKHAEILFVTFDTKITEVVGTLKKAKKTFNVRGRGGTDFNQIIDFAEKENCDGLVIFTDGEASAPPKPKKLKVCWLMDDERKYPPVKWGRVVKLNRFSDYHW